jgi:hypothetical protein
LCSSRSSLAGGQRRHTPGGGGFTVPEALRRHPWLEPLRGEAAFGALVERAEAVRGDAGRAFHEAGGPVLLGV